MLVGGFTLFLGVLAAQADADGSGMYFLAGLALFILGVWMWWRSPKPEVPPSDRFRILRKTSKKDGADRRGTLSYTSNSDQPSKRDSGRPS